MESAVFYGGMLILGGAVGLISNALGLGGGVFMVPAFLEFVPGMDAHTAKGSSLFIIIFVAAVNAWRLNRGCPDKPWAAAAFIASGSILGAYFGGWATGFVPERGVIGIFVFLLVVLSVRTLLIEPATVTQDAVRRRRVLTFLIGLAAGVVSGATGLGGGAVVVPLALMAGIASNERVVGLSNMVMVATCLAATTAHLQGQQEFDMPWTFGQVNIVLAPAVFIGAQLFSPLGRWTNRKLTLRHRRVALGAVLLIIAGRLFWRLWA